MFRNDRKINISKNFFLSILIICLIVAILGVNIDNSYASDVNSTNDELGVKLTLEDKLGNSQTNNENLKQIDSDDNENSDTVKLQWVDEDKESGKLDDSLKSSSDSELLGSTYTLTNGNFADIQAKINSANSGDTIKLSGTFKASNADSMIKITKKLTITSDSSATLDGIQKSMILRIYEGGQGTVIKNINFINAHGVDRGGAIRVSAMDVRIENCNFQNNFARVGGAIASDYNSSTAQNLLIQKCTFKQNRADGHDIANPISNISAGGAVAVHGYNTQLISCTFDSNWAKSKDAYGGAIQIGMDYGDSKCKVIDCVFRNNYAIATATTSHGGVGCVRDGISYINCLFENNYADQGGALTMHSSGSIINCNFTNNKAKSLYGGAISSGFLYTTMVLNISNCKFEGNSAPEGGAIQAIGLNVNILNSNFKSNYVTGKGGAVTIQAVNVNIDKSNFTKNIADVNGGAIYVKGVESTIKNSLFISNEAIPDVTKFNDGLGGAIYVDSPHATIVNNEFKYNTARNGSAIYYEKTGQGLILENNILFENQAWVYHLPIQVKDIYFEDTENIKVVIYGGNNIANYENLAISNAIYNAANSNQIMVDGENPLFGATMSGELYQDSREYNIEILLKVVHEDGSIVYENTLNSSYIGDITVNLDNLKPGEYYVTAKHFEDAYYKEILNESSFRVIPLVDNQITITSDKEVYNFEDFVKWTINITNEGPNNATEVVVFNLLPESLIYYSDTSGGLYDHKRGILNVSTLDVGEKLSFNIITIINQTGRIVNEANITALEIDTDLANNYDNHSIMVNPAVDLMVSKTVNNSNPNYMDIVNWTIVVRNNGPDVVHNISVQDVVPQTLILINSSEGYNKKTGMWEVESLGVGESIIFNLITRVIATGVIRNDASAYGAEYDYDLSNNRDDEIIMVDPAADLSIVKSVNAFRVNYLDTVKWTLTITNNGPNNATGVKIVDVLPEGFTYINSTLDYNDEDEIYVGNLAVGQSMDIDIICLVETTGNYTNFANVTGREYDYDLDNNEDNESIIVDPASDMEVEKTVDDNQPEYGDYVYWTIVVRNNGPDVAHNVVVQDKLPVGLEYISDDSEGDYNPQTGICDIGILEVGDEASIEIYTRINKTGILVNNVNVTAHEYDYDLDNNQDNESVEVKPSADIEIIKTVNNTSPNYLDTVKWTVIVKNNGPDTATNIEVEEIIPDGLILINLTVSKGVYEDDLWTMDSLEKDEVQRLEIISRVNKTGNITNIVVASAEEYDPNLTNNEDNETIDVPPAVDIEVIQDVNNSNPYFGEEITWRITIKNNGPDNGTQVQLTDILPKSLIFTGYNATKGEYSDGIWNVSTLEVGEVEYLNITSIANETGIIINDAQATSYEYDWNMSNNYDNAWINVLPVTDLAIEKYVSNPTPNYLDTIIWTLKVTNNGPNDAINVKVEDNLPKSLQFIKSDNANYNNGIWYVGELKDGEEMYLHITTKVLSTGLIINNATVTGDNYDPNLDNNYAEESISPIPASDLSVTKITSKQHYYVGDVVKYIITVVNNGPDTAYNVKVKDILDKSLVLKSIKASKGKFNKATNTWEIESLQNGESAVLFLNVIATSEGVVKNIVTVTSDSFDYNMSNNNDTCFVNVTKKPEIKNITNPPKKEIKALKLRLHRTGNPLSLLIVSIFCFGGVFIRKII